MIHLYYPTLPSTQNHLLTKREQLLEAWGKQTIIVQTEHQTQGVGRGQNRWQYCGKSLFFSFQIPHKNISFPHQLISLNTAVLIRNFFYSQYQKEIFLKWPNDLFDSQKRKCGGILIHSVANTFIIGIGINLHVQKKRTLNLNPGSLFCHHQNLNTHVLCSSLVKDLVKKLSSSHHNICEDWSKYCFHFNQAVTIKGSKEYSGFFKGITSDGAAIIDDKHFYNGSLIIH